MHVLSLNFTILQFCGIWRPLLWSSGCKSVIYDFYTFAMIFTIHTFAISECIELVVSYEKFEEFVQGSFILLTIIGVCGKALNLIIKRQEISQLGYLLTNELCEPRTPQEIEIQLDCEHKARSNTIVYTTLTVSTAAFIFLRSLIVDIPDRNLPFEAWLPYPHGSSEIGFWFAYLHQFIAAFTGAVINSAFDTLIPGFMMQICAQMKILKCRISSMPKNIEERMKMFSGESNEEYHREIRSMESEFLSKCIRHHVEIFRLANISNGIFGDVVLLQFAVSTLVLCASVYEISKMELFSSEFTAIAMYLACMLVQIFIYCFYGGELSIESVAISGAVYEMEWSSLGIGAKKSLMTIMLRSQRPITFICSHAIKLSIDSFTSLVKLSYSAYNVLSNDR